MTSRGPRAPEGPVHRLTRDIDDVESAALCPATASGSPWAAAPTSASAAGTPRRTSRSSPRARAAGSSAALAFRPDLGLLVAAQQQRMEIIAWVLAGAARRQWAVASGAERVREALTPRLHGRPPWIPRWVGISPDGQRVASIRDDGTVSLWSRTGGGAQVDARARTTATWTRRLRPRMLVVVHAREAGSPPSTRSASACCSRWRTGRRAHAARRAPVRGPRQVSGAGGPDGVMFHALPSGAAAVTLPVREPVWRLAMSGDGRVVAMATQHRVSFWSLMREP